MREQVKPVVLYWHRIEVNGKKIKPILPWYEHELMEIAEEDLCGYGVKSRFRPVYTKGQYYD